MYWIRIRITSVASQTPLLDRLKVHSNTHKINESGITEYFGNTRPIQRIDWDVNTAKSTNETPSDGTTYISKSLSVGSSNTIFGPYKISRTSVNYYVPTNMDTSIPVKLIWSWMNNQTGGFVRWVVRHAYTNDGDSIGETPPSVPEQSNNEQIQVLTQSISLTNKQQTNIAYLAFPNATARPENGKAPSLLWISLERDGIDPGDTNEGSVYMININMRYAAWRTGEFLDMYGNYQQ